MEERNLGKGGGPLHVDEEEIKAEIRRQADELSAQGIDTSIQMVDVMLGGPAHAIVEIANNAGADLIVLGTRGHSPVAGLLLGSVTSGCFTSPAGRCSPFRRPSRKTAS